MVQENLLNSEYEAMTEEMGFQVIDATLSIEEQQQQMRDLVQKKLGRSLHTGALYSVERGKNGSEGLSTTE